MNEMHASNRRFWDVTAPKWKQLRDRDELWRRVCQEPELAFDGQALETIRESVGEPAGKDVCITAAETITPLLPLPDSVRG